MMSFFLTKYSQAQICVGTPGELQWEAYNGLDDYQFSDLYAHAYFPSRPDTIKPIFKLQSPTNYNNYFGSRVAGFISVPTTTTAQFNITGDNKVRFFLSTDDNPENKALVAEVVDAVDPLEHNIYPAQTTGNVTLQAGAYYYFEVEHIDNWSGDYFRVWWKTDLVDANNWNVITAAYLYGIGCDATCAAPGTPCDDGDPSTSNDIEDGYCNCFGEKTTSNSCIGERGSVTGYRYDNIPGGNLNDLYAATNFPGMPGSSEVYHELGRRRTNSYSDVGFMVQAYLTVPVSGNYKFNVTGDDYTILFLSSDEDPENRQAHQMLVSGWSNPTEHDKYIYQSSSNIYLEKGKYYYIELNEKDGGGSEHFAAFWQTPFTEPGQWKRIPGIYIHNYECTIACIPQGTLCDDGDPYTNNDIYDDQCQCTGMPCSGPDCDSPLANYIPFDDCSFTDQLDNRLEDSWTSCTQSTNPNPVRGLSHWIMYDLGERHELYNSRIWNYNVPGELTKGMSAVTIDYSLDGIIWETLGAYNWSLATGEDGYTGFNGPDFNGAYARYVIITCLDASPSCKGLGKVAFTAVKCPLSGTICDDGDEATFNDKYNNNCECAGSKIDENDCVDEVLALGDTTIHTSKYSAKQTILSLNDIAAENRVGFVAGNAITLEPGFETKTNTVFVAAIDPCDNTSAMIISRAQIIDQERQKREEDKIKVLSVEKLEGDQYMVSFYLEEPGVARLDIKDSMGNLIFNLVNHEFSNKGLYRKIFSSRKFNGTNYKVEFKTKENTMIEKLTIL